MKVVTAGIINRESQFLVARRAANQKLSGFWEFPGGKVETGETLQACLERELLEELGVSAVAGEVLMGSRYDYEHGAILLVASSFTRSLNRSTLASATGLAVKVELTQTIALSRLAVSRVRKRDWPEALRIHDCSPLPKNRSFKNG